MPRKKPTDAIKHVADTRPNIPTRELADFAADDDVAANSLITFKKTTNATGVFLPGTADFILWYGKQREHTKYRDLFLDKVAGKDGSAGYTWLELKD